ncbi:hypothetical protein GCM10017044_10230 [Kordiimonas sediminis]|uniref:Uncharacterized protein n=1 Tax=Kordiimonas sediminis TaxID=1735581 RepID=A0A919E440_9PROT|nr:hypothetical protein GCM10017044_10230 [Kordiimonas sediminis]
MAIIVLLEVNRPESLLVRVEPMERSDTLGPVSKSFVDGLSLELATKIASLPKLRAIGPIDLSNDKDVDVVLRGQLAKGSDRLHLVVSLSDWKTGEIVWGQTYDRPFEEVFEVQRDIALHISFMLFDQVDPEASERLKQGPTKNYQAYALFVQALGSKDRDKALALEYVSAALIHDPSFEAAIKLKRVLEGGS